MKIISNTLHKTIIKFISCYEEFKDFDFERINRICIYEEDDTGFIGKTNPLNINGRLEFEILLHQSILNNISKEEQRLIILHEFFHCKEMLITSQYINWQNIYFADQHSKMYDIILEFGYFQLSEYYAYYNCAKYIQRDVWLDNFVYKTYIKLTVMTRSTNPGCIRLYPEDKECLENLASHLVILIAQYSYSHDLKYIDEIEKFNTEKYQKLYKYMKSLLDSLHAFYEQYPGNLSEQSLLEYGKLLYSMIHHYDLQYSTEDLSDNFVLKYLPSQ